eukprot:TRINITY_DN63224_c0_g1_i1.p1 TRINITY_DN63224_c0_g1~~TRINITY_DN63224_c0_g1_i1.p1  ORF type:complete len:558 (+),score=184.57 TRINITY_DN63224_c0_g1_i1:53-1726(+)
MAAVGSPQRMSEFTPLPRTAATEEAAAAPAFYCAACGEYFASAGEFRAHSKSERHVYNTKRKLNNLRPISQEAWDRKLREARNAAGAQAQNKGTAHLKSGKEPKEKKTPKSPALAPTDPDAEPSVASTASAAPASLEEQEPPSPRRCLFDRRHFETVDACLAYMEKKYSFFVPDRDYCTDVPGLLLHLRKKINEPPHQCIACNRPFPDAASVRRHMFDKCHTHLCSEVHTRRGLADHAGSDQMQAELEDFYDFRASVKEVMERFRAPQKASALLRFFDADGDGRLDFTELSALWAAGNDGAELSEAQYTGACGLAEVDPDEGVDASALGKLYASGLADLDAHFAMLQEKLIAAKPKKKKGSKEDEENAEENAEEDAKEGEEAEKDAEEDAEEDEDEDDEEGDDTFDDEASEVEVLECEDEDEFEEVMRVLGLVQVDVTDTGDLRLPNGGTAAHRSVAHIFRQRGVRPDASQLQRPGSQKALGDRRAQFMLANAPHGTKVAVSARQSKREGKRVIAMLKQKNQYDMNLGMKHNLIQTNRIMKTRSVRGDASGAGGGGR